MWGFSSERKRASCILQQAGMSPGSMRLYSKGAAELMLKDCTK